MDLWQSLLVGLVTGIVGVGIGAWMTAHQERAVQDRLNAGAARVTFFELAENTSYLNTAINNAVTTAVVTTTWPETRARLASTLGPADIAVVATAYMKLTATGAAWAHFLPGTPQGPDSIKATREVLDRVEAAAAILESKGWPKPEDRKALVAQLAEQAKVK